MIFALLIAAIIWNLGTWALGIPASSSHTLVGSIIGVGVANQLMDVSGTGASGVDWNQAANVFRTLLVSPLFGFMMAAILVVILKLVANAVMKKNKLFDTPDANAPPPTSTACRSARRRCCPRASPAPWPPTAPACNGSPCAPSPWPGCSPSRPR